MALSPPLPAETSAGGLVVKLGYAAGNLGKSTIWASFESFLLFYLVTQAGMAPMVAGAVLAVALVWDGLADVGVAWWSDRRGRRDMLGRLIAWGAPLCAVGFVSIFHARGHGSILLVAAIMLCRLGYTLCDVGHNTLLVRVTSDERDAATVSGLRLIFSAMGGGIVGLASVSILGIADLNDRGDAFATWALGGGVLYLVTLLTAMAVCRGLPAPAARRGPAPEKGHASLFRNRNFRQVLLIIAVQSCMTPIFVRSLPFFAELTHRDTDWAGQALMIITLAQALSLPMWMSCARIKSPAMLLTMAHGGVVVAMILLELAHHGWGAYAAVAVLGCAQGGMNMAIWAMLAQSAREISSPSGTAEALPVGLFLAVLKCASGLGQALFSGVLAMGNLHHGPYGWADPEWIAGVLLGIAGSGSLIIFVIVSHAGLKKSA